MVVYIATTRLIDPKVYAAAGLDVNEAVAAAAANPHWRQTKQFAARKVITFFHEVGLIAGPGKLLWRRAGIVLKSLLTDDVLALPVSAFFISEDLAGIPPGPELARILVLLSSCLGGRVSIVWRSSRRSIDRQITNGPG